LSAGCPEKPILDRDYFFTEKAFMWATANSVTRLGKLFGKNDQKLIKEGLKML
jgi:hypothetical protein